MRHLERKALSPGRLPVPKLPSLGPRGAPDFALLGYLCRHSHLAPACPVGVTIPGWRSGDGTSGWPGPAGGSQGLEDRRCLPQVGHEFRSLWGMHQPGRQRTPVLKCRHPTKVRGGQTRCRVGRSTEAVRQVACSTARARGMGTEVGFWERWAYSEAQPQKCRGLGGGQGKTCSP